MLQEVQKIFKSHDAGLSTKMNPRHFKFGTLGICKIVYCLQATYTKKMVQDSFEESGIYKYSTSTYDLNTILGNCTTNIAPEDGLRICECMSRLKIVMLKEGEISDDVFDSMRIGDPSDRVSDLVLYRRRFIILTNSAFVEAELFKKIKKEVDAKAASEKREMGKQKRLAAKDAISKKQKQKTPIVCGVHESEDIEGGLSFTLKFKS